MRRHALALVPMLLLAAAPARLAAEANAALVLGNERYESLGGLPGGAEVIGALQGVDALDFDISARADAPVGEAARAIAAFMAEVPEAERLLVVLSGRFVTDGERTWFMTADAARPGILSLGRSALSIESVLAVLARSPSRALMVLGVDPEAREALDPWLREGVGAIDVPQGVTVLTATPAAAADLLRNELAVPQGDLSELLTANGQVAVDGYLPRGFAFMPARAETPPEPPVVEVPEVDAEEEAAWSGAAALDTLEAYQAYLRAYPGGAHVAEAEAAVEAILNEPNREARLAEARLGLTRAQRRVIQERLALLDFDPRGIDGVFGPGTRAALINWQQENGFAQTGYLTAEEVARIEAQAARRTAEAEAEAERQQQAALAADRAYWEETGARGDESGLRAYLERYPEGRYAEAAAGRLREFDEGRRRAAAEEERAAWDTARAADTPRSYQRYLEAFPEGRFAEEAQSRVRALAEREGEAGDRAAARDAERALGLNALTARVIEQRLEALGLEAGEVDGEFDDATRRALRGFQRDRGLPVSGFLNEPTLVRLLADTLGRELGD